MSGPPSREPGMVGVVNDRLEALLEVTVSGRGGEAGQTVVVDTGFSGALLLPESAVANLALPHLGYAEAELADGTVVALKEHAAHVLWMGRGVATWVWTAPDVDALLGTELLDGHHLTIDYVARRVEVS
jgi:clan AA aspartic protease